MATDDRAELLLCERCKKSMAEHTPLAWCEACESMENFHTSGARQVIALGLGALFGGRSYGERKERLADADYLLNELREAGYKVVKR